jgi:hypothetical protein
MINADEPIFAYYNEETNEYIRGFLKEKIELSKRGELGKFDFEFEALVIQKNGNRV